MCDKSIAETAMYIIGRGVHVGRPQINAMSPIFRNLLQAYRVAQVFGVVSSGLSAGLKDPFQEPKHN